MTRLVAAFLLSGLIIAQFNSCSRSRGAASTQPPFGATLKIKRVPGEPCSSYRALYLVTEDFEPVVENPAQAKEAAEILRYAGQLASTYRVPWTHFVDFNILTPAVEPGNPELQNETKQLIRELSNAWGRGDDIELHAHGRIRDPLLDYMKSREKLHLDVNQIEGSLDYRQRTSFFFNSFYREGYRSLLLTLAYGKRFLESEVYGDKARILAFRPGGWDHGSSEQDYLVYFNALASAGIQVNSGLSGGKFGSKDWYVGDYPPDNLKSMSFQGKSLFEVSPTRGPGGYVNPVLSPDLEKLAASSSGDSIPVIVSVYHLGGLQSTDRKDREAEEATGTVPSIEMQRQALEAHFRSVAELREKKILYPITIRELVDLISRQAE